MHARAETPATTGLRNRLVEFAGAASIEVTTREPEALAVLEELLPRGTSVYVTHTPSATLAGVAETACRLEALGFRAWPHLVARRMPGERALDQALGRMRAAGIDRALLVAGDLSAPSGTFTCTLDVIATGALARHGLRSLAVAGHPEGHKRIGSTGLWSALRDKQEYAEVTGTRMHIVSQFGFDPGALAAWDRQLTEHGIGLPVHVGIAGPASLRTLIRYAMLCGIGASLNALMTNLSALSSVRHLATTAEEVLLQVVRALEGALARRIVQPHFFSFGGAARTARWLSAIQGGDFDFDPDTDRLVVRA